MSGDGKDSSRVRTLQLFWSISFLLAIVRFGVDGESKYEAVKVISGAKRDVF